MLGISRGEVAKVGGGELDGVKEKSGSTAVNSSIENCLHDLLNCDLNGVAVFEQREFDGGFCLASERETDALKTALTGSCLVVPITEIRVSQGDGITDFSIDEDVVAGTFFAHRKSAHKGAVYPLLYFPVKI